MIQRISLLLPLLALLVACNSTPTAQDTDPLQQASAISVTLPGFVTNPDTTLHWHSELLWVDDPEGRYERRAVVLQQALQKELERKGYRFVDSDEQANYDVLAVAMLGELKNQEDVESFFRLYPSLAKPAKGYGRGTVLVAIAPAGTSDIVWRGALEVYTDPGKMPLAQREQRLQWAAKKLLASIPTLPCATGSVAAADRDC